MRKMRTLPALVAVAAVALGAIPGTSSAAPRRSHVVTCSSAAHHPKAKTANATPFPSKEECNRAKKILTQWERLARKLGIKISKKRRDELRRKTQDGTITIHDLPAGLRRRFPSELDRFDLNQIINICNGLPPGDGRTITV
jgi:hypothetical protein